ncbi:glycosyltransferase family 4 protein [Dyella sp. GSA-30]|uniref:glycosyltransferase family 4 protein n=1 Tax=Dyella sp. GSA-30 TaxID=2994496 RepID=UPI0024920E0F|nr:glycosyltransferase family 4 protein [Dyella sp. GSA-30]BDU20400.1 hypothetical protein DYGSA30_18570 [Dyella sp. GSA-30]
MRLVLISDGCPHDISLFSGTLYFMYKALRMEFEVVFEGWGLTGDELNEKLSGSNVEADYILCASGSGVIPKYNYHIPIVFWHDSTWHTYQHAYIDEARFSNFKLEDREHYLWDMAVLSKCDILVYSSDYVADACVKDYGVDRSKVKVIPFGANIFEPPSADNLEKILSERISSDTLKLMFLGMDFWRKGALSAIRLTEKLNSMGIKSILNVVGCKVESDYEGVPNVINWGRLNKNDERDLDILLGIFRDSHFLVHPAVSEPFGIALCEANSYGMPVIGTDVEGLKTIVKHGENGYLFSREDYVEKTSGLIRSIYDDFSKNYTTLFYNSLSEFNSRLNWTSSAKRLKEVLREHALVSRP